jgi:RNA polymerase sigma-70 factor (ECF subfamily)
MNEDPELERIFRAHYAALYAVALKFVISPDIAQDITQDVLVRFWERRYLHRGLTSIENFLFTAIKHESLNYLRSRQRAEKRHQHLAPASSEAPAVLNLLIEEETNQLLVEAINQLPEQSARVMRLLLSGYENKEVALILGVSVNTIKTLKYGAIRKLREYFLNRDQRLHPNG